MHFTNEPAFVPYADYEQALAQYLHRVKDVPGVSSVYTMGSVGAPGLSDIDVIVVVKDDFKASLSQQLGTLKIDSRLFIHGPVVVPESLSDNFQSIIYATGLDCLHGNDVLQRFSDVPIDEATVLRMVYLIDFMESRQIQYATAFALGTIDQRQWMARLWSLTHSEQLFVDVDLSLSEGQEALLESIRQLRKDWVDNGHFNPELFKSTFFKSVGISKELLLKALLELYPNSNADWQDSGNLFLGNKMIFLQNFPSAK